MMEKWGLSGMASFDQKSVKTRERFPIEDASVTDKQASAHV